MSYCSQCGNAIDNGAKFCSHCGAAVAAAAAPVYNEVPEVNTLPVEPAPVATAPVVAAPVATAPVATAPAVAAEPVVSAGTKVLGFVGMGLGIGALFFAVIGLISTLQGLEEVGMGFGMSIGFGMFSVPAAIVSRILCNKSIQAGNTSAVCNVGSKLSLAAIIVSGVMAFIGMLSLVEL